MCIRIPQGPSLLAEVFLHLMVPYQKDTCTFDLLQVNKERLLLLMAGVFC